MRLKSLRLVDFRGFSDLTVEGIPSTAKLVMLIGPNGTGKSSIFDALVTWAGMVGGGGHGWSDDFHVKQHVGKKSGWANNVKAELHGGPPNTGPGWEKFIYFRSAYRNEPELRQGNLSDVPAPTQRTFYRTIENDAAISVNYRRLIMQTIRDVWGAGGSQKLTLEEYANLVMNKVNDSLSRVLPHLRMESLGDPGAQKGNFYFTKGISKNYLFMNLSGGEKAVFDMLIDLIARGAYFDDSLFCIDEPESHVNPAVQGALLEELLKLVPEKSQLLVATHAIGMLRKARDLEAAQPGSVAFLNFTGSFDSQVVMGPTPMDRAAWKQALVVAFDDLAALVSPKRIVVCEGGSGGFVADGIDAQVYSAIFGRAAPDTEFFSAGSHADTQQARKILMSLSATALPGLEVRRLIDRDDQSDAEVAAARAGGTRVLSVRNLESYLFSDEVLTLLCNSVGQPVVASGLIKARDALIKEKGAKPDDYKAVSGETYVACKTQLGLTKAGNNAKAFMRDTLAPLIVDGTMTYAHLEADILGP